MLGGKLRQNTPVNYSRLVCAIKLFSQASSKNSIILFRTDYKEVAPSNRCYVFYNENGETLFIYSKKLMTQADIIRLEEEPSTLDNAGIDGNEVINANVPVDGENDEMENTDENSSRESEEISMDEDFSSAHGNNTNNVELSFVEYFFPSFQYFRREIFRIMKENPSGLKLNNHN